MRGYARSFRISWVIDHTARVLMIGMKHRLHELIELAQIILCLISVIIVSQCPPLLAYKFLKKLLILNILT